MNRIVFYFAIICFLVPGFVYGQAGPIFVGEPSIPVLTPPVRDMPQASPDKSDFQIEAKRRDDHGIVVPDIQGDEWLDKPNPLAVLQEAAARLATRDTRAFDTPTMNIAGYTSSSSPPDTTGDVGHVYFVQGANTGGTSQFHVYRKSDGNHMGSWSIDSFGTGSCVNGYCDPIIMYDEAADRWIITEFDSSISHLCVLVSQTSDPLGSYYAYDFNVGGSQDYPKYGVWHDGYYVGVNNGGTVWVLQKPAMLTGSPATFQGFSIPTLSGFGFQLTVPTNAEGATPPPTSSGCFFLRPIDTEIHSGYTCSGEPCDLMDIWELKVNWTTPANSTFTRLPYVNIAEYDHTLCGTGSDWSCMPQAGTSQQLDPIREPIHFPLQYRNFGTYETIVGCFAEDVDSTDRAAVHWFEFRREGGNWYNYQDGVVTSADSVHRSVCSAAMDVSGNIAVGYTRTSSSHYPSIYYSGRLATDTLGTMPSFDNVIINATTSKTGNERWGDYAGIGVDPEDECTFWYTTEYGGSGQTRIAAFRFDECGCEMPGIPSGLTATAGGANQISLTWSHGSPAADTFNVYRKIGSCPQTGYSLIASGIAGTSYADNAVSGGITYAYIVRAVDETGNCISDPSNCDDATATGICSEPPLFAGITSVVNPYNAICTLELNWSAGTAYCGGPILYHIYRSTTQGFTPGPGSLIGSLYSTSHNDMNGLVSGTTYYYVVRAEDETTGIYETNTVELSGTPVGPGGGLQTLLDEDFQGTWGPTGATPPTGWTIEDHGSESPAVWNNNDWHNYAKGGVYGAVARVYYSPIENQDDWLISPTFNIPALSSTVSLEFDHYFYIYSTPQERGYVDIWTDQSPAWNNVITYSATTANMAHAVLSLAAYTGHTNAKIRFRYVANNDWYWEVDNVLVTSMVENPCTTGSGCPGNPFVDVTPNGPLTLCEGASQLLTANLSGGTAPFQYQWTEDGINISGANSSTYSANTTGTHAYNCKVRGSGCSDDALDGAATSITWQYEPTFAGLTSAVDGGESTCTIDLTWSAASSACPGPFSYSIYRDTVSPVATIPANRIASNVSGTTYSDSNTLSSGTTYYYVVHAVDQSNFAEDTNIVERFAAPSGPGGGNQSLFFDDFESGNSWTFAGAGEWQHGSPSGLGGDYGNPDPAAAYSGSNVIGNDLTGLGSYLGDYEPGLTATTATSPVIDCSNATGVSLSFRRYLNVEQPLYDGASIHVSTNGSTFTQVWASSATIADAAWSLQTIDISALADNQPTVYIRFRIDKSDSSWQYSGWNIDDVNVSGYIASSCTTGGGSVPPEIMPMNWSDKETLGWNAEATATSGYVLFRGLYADLPDLLSSNTDFCIRATTADETLNSVAGITETAPTGDCYYFLVCGENAMGAGSVGYATAGERVLNDTGACP